jgi:biotin-dependent carboxylase-like uncharacterized protein
MRTIDVIAAGPLTTIQDLGRPGWAHIGVPRSGAADRSSLIRANRLVGNASGAPALETTLAGPKLRVDADMTIALTGAHVSANVGDREVPMDEPFELAAGDLLRVGMARRGLRTYIAFAGGINAELSLGSAATDLLTGLGPAQLRTGDVLEIREPEDLAERVDGNEITDPQDPADREDVVLDRSAIPGEPGPASGASGEWHPTLRIVLGPRQDRFSAAALEALTSKPFAVNASSNRVGVRLNGPALQHIDTGELLSEGLIAGALQVPGDGQPIMLLADHPTTGGYPVIAVVIDADLSLAAQLRPGQQLRFSQVVDATAQRGSPSARGHARDPRP